MSQGYNSQKWDRDTIVKAFSNLPSMDAGSNKVLDDFWKNLKIIEAPYAAPTARAGNVRIMGKAIVEHAEASKP